MTYQKPISALVIVIVLFSGFSAAVGIFSSGGPGTYEYESIRGETVEIDGKGVYRHMSKDVAPQGIAQDVVTLIFGIPILLIALYSARNRSLAGRYVLSGILGYFLVTYLFYTVMGMYNELFLAYVTLLGCSFFAFSLSLFSFKLDDLPNKFAKSIPVKTAGGFLIMNSLMIALLWLEVVGPPLLDGTIIPDQTEHYTTLIVQGLDLGLLLPICFVAAVLFLKKRPMGFLLAPVYLVFLSLLMLALTAKIIAMGLLGQNIMPVIVIIPTIMLGSILFSYLILRGVHK